MSVQAGDLATWVQDVVIALTAVYAVKAFRKQSEELKSNQKFNEKQSTVLDLQANELRVARADRHRDQASRVFMDYYMHRNRDSRNQVSDSEDSLQVIVTNTSDRPIYDVNIHWNTDLISPAWSYSAQHLRPDHRCSETQSWPTSEKSTGVNPTISFRDSFGAHWDCTKSGILTERKGDPIHIDITKGQGSIRPLE
jgi:hypothetical protein